MLIILFLSYQGALITILIKIQIFWDTKTENIELLKYTISIKFVKRNSLNDRGSCLKWDVLLIKFFGVN